MVVGKVCAPFLTPELESDFRENYDIVRPFAAIGSKDCYAQVVYFAKFRSFPEADIGSYCSEFSL